MKWTLENIEVEILELKEMISKESCPVRPIPAYKAGLYGLTENQQLSNSSPKPAFIPVHRTGFSAYFNKFSRRRGLKNEVDSPCGDRPDRPGGYDKDYWGSRFRYLHYNLEMLKKLKTTYESKDARIELNRVNNAIRFFGNQLSEWERKASFAVVPHNWRE